MSPLNVQKMKVPALKKKKMITMCAKLHCFPPDQFQKDHGQSLCVCNMCNQCRIYLQHMNMPISKRPSSMVFSLH